MIQKKTALFDVHMSLGAKMVEFADYLLPVRYQSEKEEHMAVRKHVGIFDVSHMGEFFVTGKNARLFLNHMLSNNLNRLLQDQAQYSLLLNHDGGIKDDLIVYHIDDDRFLLCVNAVNIKKDFRYFSKESTNFNDVVVENVSEQYAQIAVQGPDSFALIKSTTIYSLPKKFFSKQISIGNIAALIARTGYTGEDGFEIFVHNQDAVQLWNILLDAGRAFFIKPCGLAARDSLRLEAGYLLHGQDIDESTTPLEAGLMFAVDLEKSYFVGKEALLLQKEIGVKKKLVAFKLKEPGIARHGFKVLDTAKHEIGVVSSGTILPQQKTAIGLAYVAIEHTKYSKDCLIDIRGKLAKACLI
jgi:aminomethyltransferase